MSINSVKVGWPSDAETMPVVSTRHPDAQDAAQLVMLELSRGSGPSLPWDMAGERNGCLRTEQTLAGIVPRYLAKAGMIK